MTEVRRGRLEDREDIARIQAACPSAAQWEVSHYFDHEVWVACCDARLAGFLVARTLVPGECEVLNVAVLPAYRRQGVGRALFESLLSGFHGMVYLEVRESNAPARKLYKSLGFQELTLRADYYDSPREPAIVLKFHSC